MNESKEELMKVLMDNRITCKPILILCNKADLRNPKNEDENTMAMLDIADSLDIEKLLYESSTTYEEIVKPNARMVCYSILCIFIIAMH